VFLDVALFAAIVLAYAPAVTGISIHEWLGVAIIVPSLFHLVLNWEWVVRTAKNVFAKLTATTWANAVVDIVLFVAAVTVSLSGLLISQVVLATLGISAGASAVWHTVHSVSADIAVVALLVHFALHGKWMANVLQGWIERIDNPRPSAVNATASQPRR